MGGNQSVLGCAHCDLGYFAAVGLSRRFLQIRALFCQDCAVNRANLKTDTAVNTGCKINPVPTGALGVFTGTIMDTAHGASIDTVCNALADIGDNGMSHDFLSSRNAICFF
jgi:hypothetical protein